MRELVDQEFVSAFAGQLVDCDDVVFLDEFRDPFRRRPPLFFVSVNVTEHPLAGRSYVERQGKLDDVRTVLFLYQLYPFFVADELDMLESPGETGFPFPVFFGRFFRR